MYDYLLKNEITSINYPRIIEMNHQNLILEFINGKKGWDSSTVTRENFANELIKFNMLSNVEIKTNRSFHMLFSIFKGLMRAFIFKKIDLKTAIKIIQYSIDENSEQEPVRPMLLHNDLYGPNNLITKDNKIYFIDFESVIYESKWVLKDIVELCFDRRKEIYDWELFNEYRKKLALNYSDYHSLKIESQIRLILINRMLRILNSKVSNVTEKQKKYSYSFLKEILLSTDNFKQWITKGIK